jgi:CheY-like chemotaxis protein
MLLVEDNASIQQFMDMVLEPHPIDLSVAGTLAEARGALRAGQFDLVVTDLMLPDGSGLELLQQLRDDPSLRKNAELAVFSAGVNDAVRARLGRLGVDRVMTKPAPLAELERQVLEAIEPALRQPHDAPPDAPAVAGSAEQRAIDAYFGGNATLFLAFRQSCLTQFGRDMADGDAALAGHDMAALRRVAHSLKSVLLTLGHPDLSELARQAEHDAEAGGPDAARSWRDLRAGLAGLNSSGP